MNICIHGKTVQQGCFISRIKVYKKAGAIVNRIKAANFQDEIYRLEKAVDITLQKLQILYDEALKNASEESAAIFEAHQMMLRDEDYIDSIKNIIEKESVNAEYAVAVAEDNFSAMFEAMDDEYMKARSADVKDISAGLISVLQGKAVDDFFDTDSKVILLAQDLSPSETVRMDKAKIGAIVTVYGSVTSHTAILARTMNIPALVNAGVEDIDALDGKEAIVDGNEGLLIVDPDEDTIRSYEAKMEEADKLKNLLYELKGKPTVTKNGRKINLFANVGSIGDIAIAKSNDAEGIGLFRSEFIYFGRNDYPTEEEQFLIYKQALQLMGKKRVIIRTCDIGADKQINYFNLDKEDNPALGLRAIRICLSRKDFFKTQLRALFRAGVYGNLSIMYPMITSLDEVKKIKEIVAEVNAELDSLEIPYSPNIEQGIMIETPAAAIISDQLAKEVDFFSVGTNDLTQYTLAMDRQNSKLEALYDKHHPAVLALIKMAADNAHANGKWIGICGELGADLELTGQFIDMGIDELSVSPGMILKLREKIRSL